MELIVARKLKKRSNGEDIEVPRMSTALTTDRLCGVLSFAINSLANKPYEAGRFKIDQDFCPLVQRRRGPRFDALSFRIFVIIVEVGDR